MRKACPNQRLGLIRMHAQCWRNEILTVDGRNLAPITMILGRMGCIPLLPPPENAIFAPATPQESTKGSPGKNSISIQQNNGKQVSSLRIAFGLFFVEID